MMRRLLSAITLIVITSLASPLSAIAFDPFSGACNAAGTGSSVACNTSCNPNAASKSKNCTGPSIDPVGGTQGLLIKLTHLVAFFAGGIAVIMIIVASIKFITSGTDLSTGSRTDTDVEEAKSTIAGALLGLLVIALGQIVITYAIKRF